LLHGGADRTVPVEGAAVMERALRALGAPAASVVFEGKTHTDLLLEDAFRGGRDVLAGALSVVCSFVALFCWRVLIHWTLPCLCVYAPKTNLTSNHSSALAQTNTQQQTNARHKHTDTIMEVVTGRPHASHYARMCPGPLIWLASRVCPF
jgi:acetyl esterase/lipase